MTKHLLLVATLMGSLVAEAQNCTRTSTGYPPLNDLGTGSWRGAQGGLYPGGSNQRPSAHDAAGLSMARQIGPLNAAGLPDTSGKVVWLSVGMSNTTQESSAFIPMADTLGNRNPKLVTVDGAQGGQDINIIVNANAAFWTNINTRLQQKGLTPEQVQVVWFKEAEANPTDSSFANYPDALKVKFRTAIQIIKSKFPNTKLCYLSNRIYAGYATSTLNPEPYAYYSGWSIKRLIEDQINGDTSLRYSGSNARAPWLAWGPYLWADGTTPRSDGLTWICPTDYQSDGTHPSTQGRQKVAQLLFQFFTTDATTTPWFLRQTPTGVSGMTPARCEITVYPQPAIDVVTLKFPDSSPVPGTVAIDDLAGRDLRSIATEGKRSLSISVAELPSGVYLIRAGTMRSRILKN